MNKQTKLIDLKIPDKSATFMLGRVAPFVDKFHNHQNRQAKSSYNFTENFGIRELVISAYAQGLSDGSEALKKQP